MLERECKGLAQQPMRQGHSFKTLSEAVSTHLTSVGKVITLTIMKSSSEDASSGG